MTPSNENQALDALRASLSALEAAPGKLSEEMRQAALQSARRMVVSLSKPEEIVSYYAQQIGSERMAIRVGIDIRVFRILSEANGPIDLDRLAQLTSTDSSLLVRLMRSLAATGFVAEHDVAVYTATALTHEMAEPAMEGAMTTCYDHSSRIESMMHQYFKERGYHNSIDHANCAFQWTFQTDQNYFEFLHADPERMAAFNTFMTRIRSTRRHWTEWYPVESEIIVGASEDQKEMLLVDIGGGKGHDLKEFLVRFPSSHDRLLLQDLPKTVQSTELPTGIQKMTHDFFLLQPVKGARAYYTHFVLHDWPDEKCREILRQIMPAMVPGYSKILLNEIVLPDRDCPAPFVAMDLNMMAVLAGMERSRSQWKELVESVGLQVVSIRVSPFTGDSEGVIEAIRPTT